MKKSIALTFFFYMGLITISLAQYPGDVIFGSSTMHVIQVQFTQPSFWDSLVSYKPLDKPMLASITFDGVSYDSIGIQLKGNSSYNSMPGKKKSMKITFDEFKNHTVDGLKKLNLNNGFKDPTLMREKIMLDFCREHGVNAPRATYAKVYLNGTYWGLYILVEQVDKTYLKNHLGNKDGNLFKGDPQGSLQWFGALPSAYYSKYELKTNEVTNDWSDLVHFIDEIVNTPSSFFRDSVEKVLNSDSFMRVWASNNIFANLDSYQGSGHNYYIYHNSSTNKFEFITWDVNEAFGNFSMMLPVSQLESLSPYYLTTNPVSRPLMNNMLANPTYKSAYNEIHCAFAYDFTSEKLNPKIDSIAARIRTDVYADTQKQYPNTTFELNINSNSGNTPGLKSFILNRSAYLSTQKASMNCTNAIAEQQNKSELPGVFPNPNSGTFDVSCNNIMQLKIYDLQGRDISNLFDIEKSNNTLIKVKSENLISTKFIILNILTKENNFFEKVILE